MKQQKNSVSEKGHGYFSQAQQGIGLYDYPFWSLDGKLCCHG